jgi:hypothetical protein
MPIIYQITSPSGRVYIGSTKNGLSRRKSHHYDDYKRRHLGGQRICSAFELFDEICFEACAWDILEECTEAQRHIRERFYMDSMVCVNKYRPAGTVTPEDLRADRARRRAASISPPSEHGSA